MFLSDKQLGQRFSVARTTIWRWHRTDPQFPRAVTLSSGCTRWRLEDIEAWEARVVAADPPDDDDPAPRITT